jgi:hypothetical protein
VALGLVGAALARFLVVRFAPIAEGSGVQRVEAAFSGEVKLAPYSIMPVKFFGGLIAIVTVFNCTVTIKTKDENHEGKSHTIRTTESLRGANP